MKFVDLLKEKNISGYALAKGTGIPYTTINDLINGKTIIQNISLKHAILIGDFLKVDLRTLNNLDTFSPVEFRYFRSNLLHELKRKGPNTLISQIIKSKEIDYYYKNNAKEYAYYLLALIDYLKRLNNEPLFVSRYNNLRKEKLDKPFFVGSNIVHFNSIEDAEKKMGIIVIPEFRKYNIIEGDVFNVA